MGLGSCSSVRQAYLALDLWRTRDGGGGRAAGTADGEMGGWPLGLWKWASGGEYSVMIIINLLELLKKIYIINLFEKSPFNLTINYRHQK